MATGALSSGNQNASSGLVQQIQTFGAQAPTVTATPAVQVTATSATLSGTVNANGASTTASFDYGTTTSYGTNIGAVPATITGATDTPVSATITGLTPGTIYHYRVDGTNSAGTVNSTDATFTTLSELGSWRQQYFGSSDNTGAGADTATPANDGVPNLIKFATGMAPTTPGTMPGSVNTDGTNLNFTYTRPTAVVTEVTYQVQWSTDLVTWNTTSITENVVTNGDNQVVTDSVPNTIGNGGPVFMRLTVTGQ
jgi:hypothetical protein